MNAHCWYALVIIPSSVGHIIVATSPKSGTAWTKRIISLIQGGGSCRNDAVLCPWMDARFLRFRLICWPPVWQHNPIAAPQEPPAFDALPYSPKVEYICIGREGRDVALSVHNHYRALRFRLKYT
jgi:aryl sulfotransferase